MTVVNLLQRQIEHRAELLCQNRNQGLPVGIGKSCFEPIVDGVKFLKHHYKLDSSHYDYSTPVAKIQWDQQARVWALYVPDDENAWMLYPFLGRSEDLTALIREVEKDPKSLFWS